MLVSQQSSSSNLLESTPVDVQEAREDEEAGYARLEDIRSAKESRQNARYYFRVWHVCWLKLFAFITKITRNYPIASHEARCGRIREFTEPTGFANDVCLIALFLIGRYDSETRASRVLLQL